MEVFSIEAVGGGVLAVVGGVGGRVVFLDVQLRQEPVDVLHVGDVAADADDGAAVEGA